jgi:hypothetical protein
MDPKDMFYSRVIHGADEVAIQTIDTHCATGVVYSEPGPLKHYFR